MAADVTVLTTTVNLRTTTGTQDITVGSLGTSPKAAIFLSSRVSSTNNEVVSPSFHVGMTDGTRSGCHGMWIENGQTTSDTHRDQDTDGHVIRIYGATGTVDNGTSFSAWITNGVRVSVDVTDGTDYKITVVLFFGADISNVYQDDVAVGSGTVDVTAPGFQPDLVFFSNVGVTSDSNSAAGLLTIGVAHNGGSQGAIMLGDVDGASTTNCTTYVSNTKIAGQPYNGSSDYFIDCNTFDSSGFSLTPSANAANDDIFYLALKFSNSPDIAVTHETGPTSTGNWSTTAPAFQPDFGMILTCDNSAYDTIDATDSDGFGVWCFDGTREYSIGLSSDDGVGTSDAYNRHSSDLTDYKDGNTTLHAGSFTSFDTNGATLNFTTVPGTARKWVGIWIGDASAGGGPSTPTGQMALTGAGL